MRYGFVAFMVVTIMASGCGDAAEPVTTPGPAVAPASQTPTLAATSTPREALSGIRARALRDSEFTGFAQADDLWVERDVETWTHGHGLPAAAARAEEARLRRLGFRAAFAQNLRPVDHAPAAALCVVERFRTSGAARAQVTEILAQADRLASVDRFAVPTIPGAKGFTATDATSSGTHVVFSVGRYPLRIAADGRSDSEPARGQIITAAQRLYRRVREI